MVKVVMVTRKTYCGVVADRPREVEGLRGLLAQTQQVTWAEESGSSTADPDQKARVALTHTTALTCPTTSTSEEQEQRQRCNHASPGSHVGRGHNTLRHVGEPQEEERNRRQRCHSLHHKAPIHRYLNGGWRGPKLISAEGLHTCRVTHPTQP
ncbi:hypothetical protein BDK51DRAFT_33887 [Blyttiomyces helicus]|uniref:Uncharacterized protein n=1 Tax=Blyttiomyces helicus TaxID=388810 RepID=A0A4P9WRS0_9FUNG|nr:hypothetical protein BDK51DRAFT_33887 [Blyttiomyces helicus]|eukprot:RKO94598.1 hypothetical protein BDK51DRAFT_33887 [Blyttiomyces helicus]